MTGPSRLLIVILFLGFGATLTGCAQSSLLTRQHPTEPDANWPKVKKLFGREWAERERQFLATVAELERQKPGSTDVQRLRRQYEAMRARRVAALPKEFVGPRGITFVLIRPGEFVMGSNGDWMGFRETDHRVTISRPFYMGKYEATERQLRGDGGDKPATSVSWHAATAFCQELSLATGMPFRLPTEAEWEYACRAGTTTRFSWGTQWWSEDAARKPNAWGLYDMHGNVQEWCTDWHGEYGSEAVMDPQGPETGDGRVRRGGSWSGTVGFCRSARRHWADPGTKDEDVGFRIVARDLSWPPPGLRQGN